MPFRKRYAGATSVAKAASTRNTERKKFANTSTFTKPLKNRAVPRWTKPVAPGPTGGQRNGAARASSNPATVSAGSHVRADDRESDESATITTPAVIATMSSGAMATRSVGFIGAPQGTLGRSRDAA